MTKEQLISKVGSPILTPVTIIVVCCYLTVIASPFIWIWHSWDLAWKIGLTGILGSMFSVLIFKMVKKVATEIVDENSPNVTQGKPKSKFQERLERMAKEHGYEFPKIENHE